MNIKNLLRTSVLGCAIALSTFSCQASSNNLINNGNVNGNNNIDNDRINEANTYLELAKKTFTNFINNFKELQALPENNDPNIMSSKKLSLEALNNLQDIFIEINNIGLTYMHVRILYFVLDKLISALNILCNTNNASQYNNQIKLISNILTSCTNITRHLFQYKDIKKQY